MWFMEWMFWGSIVFIIYAYAGYLLALVVLSCFRNRPVLAGDIQPMVSFVITAYNEEARIRESPILSSRSMIQRSAVSVV